MQLIQQYEDGNKTRFAKRIGLSPQGISTWLSRGTIDYELVYAKCEYLNAAWLLTGEGSMLCTEQAQPAPQPITQPDLLPGESAYIYKMYEKEKEENKALLKQIGCLEERLRQQESKIGTPAKESDPISFLEKVADAFTPDSLGGSGKDFTHTRNPATIKKSSASKT